MAQDMTFLPRDEALGLEECARLAKIFVNLGVTKVVHHRLRATVAYNCHVAV